MTTPPSSSSSSAPPPPPASPRELLQRIAWSPALLLDTAAQTAAALALLGRDDLDPDLRRDARLRAAELMRRLAPREALERLGEQLLDPQLDAEVAYALEARRIAAHAALALGRYDDARIHAELCGAGPGGELARARVEASTDRAVALARLDTALAAEPGLDAQRPEVAAELLFWRARWRAESSRFTDATDDLAALAALARRHDAPLTTALAAMGQRLVAQLAERGLDGLDLASRFAELVQGALVAGLPADALTPERLGPIPPWLHGAMVQAHTAGRPELVGRAALALALMFEVAQRFDEAEQALRFGEGLARRLGDERGAAELARHHQRLAERRAR